MITQLLSNIMTFTIVAGLALGGALHATRTAFVAEGPSEADYCLDIPAGSSMARVADRVTEAGLVNSNFIFTLYANTSGRSGQQKAGDFLIPAGASVEDIVNKVTGAGISDCGSEIIYRIGVTRTLAELRGFDDEDGSYTTLARFNYEDEAAPALYSEMREDTGTTIRMVVAEGVTSWQVREALQAIDFLENDIAEVPPEGSLAPGSYNLEAGDSRVVIIAQMQTQQSEILARAWAERAPNLPLATPEEALILASIIEKETGQDGERPQVSSVFINRLRQGMRLQTDPTVIYGVTRGEGVLGRGIRRSELDTPTPWNTYQIDGLPITPIANPGRAAIEAALNPDDTPYIFFVAKTLDPSDGHNFSTTLAEHNRFVAQYRALEREAAVAAQQ